MNDSSTPHDKVKAQFCSTASALTQLFKMSIELEKYSYNEGRKDAYADILGWLLTHGNGELKNIPMGAFMGFLQEKLDHCASYNPAEEPQEEGLPRAQYDVSKLNLSGIKITDRSKRVAPKGGAVEEGNEIKMEDAEAPPAAPAGRKLYSFKKKRLDFD